MELKNFFAQDDQGNLLGGATCYLYVRGTENLASGLQAANGSAMTNPFTADAKGLIQFAAPNGLYDLRVVKGARDYRVRVQCLDVEESVAEAEAAAGRAEVARDAAQLSAGVYINTMAGLAATTDGQYFSVPSPESDEYLILYNHNAGEAQDTGKRYPSLEYVADVAGSKAPQIPDDYLEVLIDEHGRAAMTIRNNGDVEIHSGLTANSVRSITIDGVTTSPADLTGTEYEAALEIECDSIGRIRSVLWGDGTVSSYGASPGGTIELIDIVSLPRGAQGENPNGGFACTGLDRITTGKYSYCWLVGNHGKATESLSSPQTPSVVILTPDCRQIVAEFDMSGIPGIESIQGVAWDSSDNTFWFVDKANKAIRHYTTTGVALGDSIAVPDITPNGIAYNPVRDELYASNAGTTELRAYSCATAGLVSTVAGLPTNADQLHYDADANEVWYTVGANGEDGQARAMSPSTGYTTRTYALPGSQSIEGLYKDGGCLWVANDGAYHIDANPPLALINKYLVSE